MYKEAMDCVRFDDQFAEKVIYLLAEKNMYAHRKAHECRRKQYGIAAILCVVVALIAIPAVINARNAALSSDITPTVIHTNAVSVTDISNISSENTGIIDRMVVDSDKYDVYSFEDMLLKNGDIYISASVREALEDPENSDAYFYVCINVVLQDSVYEFSKHVYNGRTIADWAELVDLAAGTYPYTEYNNQHGGNISVAEWNRLQDEAKLLNAQENYDQANSEYKEVIGPLKEEEKKEITDAEYERLSGLGYDVSFYQTWSYSDEREKDYYTVMTGVLSMKQIKEFELNEQYSYVFEWVRNGDGIVTLEDK